MKKSTKNEITLILLRLLGHNYQYYYLNAIAAIIVFSYDKRKIEKEILLKEKEDHYLYQNKYCWSKGERIIIAAILTVSMFQNHLLEILIAS